LLGIWHILCISCKEKHRLVRQLNELVQGLGGVNFSIDPLTAQCCGVTNLRAAIVAAWEAPTASKHVKTSDNNQRQHVLPLFANMIAHMQIFLFVRNNHLHSFDSRSQNDVILHRICIAHIQPQNDLHTFCLTIQPTPHWI